MSLDELKQELKNQKRAIEQKSGTVTVANTNPSPSEITAGIATIPSVKLSLANATEADVLAGKKFYSNSTTIKTGTATGLSDELMHIYFYSDQNSDFSTRVTYTTPSSISRIRSYLFYGCYNPIDVYFTDNITAIGNYSFADTSDLRYYNFTNNTHITAIGNGAFYKSSHLGLDFAHLPSNLLSIGEKGFEDTLSQGDNLVIPNSVTSIGERAFAYTSGRLRLGSLIMNTSLGGELPTAMLAGLDFNCDFTVPTGVTKINSNFNFKGCFNNVTIPSSVTTLMDNCFGATSSDSVSNYHLNTFTFEGQIPPSIGENFIALQNLENPNFKIFVPDESIEAYKAVPVIAATYLNFIHPASQQN